MSQARAAHGRNVSPEFLADRAKFVRLETVRLTRIAGAGHYSSTFSAAELFAALYYAHLRIDPADRTGRIATASSSARAMPRSGSIRCWPTSASSTRRCSTTTRASAARSATIPT